MSPDALPQNLVDRLWLRMGEIFGQRWTGPFGNDPATGAAQTWAKGLAGLTGQQVARGMSAVMTSAEPWPPTLPEFRSLCLGIPSFGVVMYQITQETKQHSPFTRLVWQRLDVYRFRHADVVTAERVLRTAYEISREFVMQGGEPPEPSVEIEHAPAPRKPSDPEVAKKAFAEMAALLREHGLDDEGVAAVAAEGQAIQAETEGTGGVEASE